MPVSANRHRAPPPPVRPRSIKKEKTARRVRARPHPHLRSLDDNFRGRSRHRREKPVHPALACHELQLPARPVLRQFVVAFRDPKNLIDRRNPLRKHALLPHHRPKRLAQPLAQPDRPRKYFSRRLRIALWQRQQISPPLPRNHMRSLEKLNQLLPRWRARARSRVRRNIGEVDGQPSAQQHASTYGFSQAPSLSRHGNRPTLWITG